MPWSISTWPPIRIRGWRSRRLVTTNRIVMAGEVRGPESVTPALIEDAARRAVREIGYEQKGFHWKNAEFQYLRA